jgi:hypothetical protein
MKFSNFQLLELERGLRLGVDISIIFDTDIDYRVMHTVISGLADDTVCNEDVKKYLICDDYKKSEVLLLALRNKLPIDDLLSQPFTAIQMHRIMDGMVDGLDYKLYSNPNLPPEKMELIYTGLKEDLDVSYYNDERFSHAQMHSILMGLRKHLNVSKFAKLEYTGSKMRAISFGMEHGVSDEDIDKILNEDLSATETWAKIRSFLPHWAF